MRIVLLINTYPPCVQGGAEITAASLAGEFTSLGHEVCVLTSACDSPCDSADLAQADLAQREQVRRTLRLTPLTANAGQQNTWRHRVWHLLDGTRRFYQGYHSPANAAELRRIVAELRPDLIYVWEITGLGINSLVRALATFPVPTVFHLGSYWLSYARSPETPQTRVHARWLKSRLIGTVPTPNWTSAIAVSSAVKADYVREGCAPERIAVIPSSVDPLFLTTPLSREDPTAQQRPTELLYIGRICAEKGVLTVLMALARLREEAHATPGNGPAFHLTIVGGGEETYLNELRAYIDEHHLSALVTLQGRVPQNDVIAYYDRADVVLVPSLWEEPFGLVVIEAMARQAAVVASAVGGPAEIITPGVDGLLVPPGDDRALAAALSHLLAHPEVRRRLGQAARKTVNARFTLEEQVSQVLAHLRGSLDQQRLARPEAAQAPEAPAHANSQPTESATGHSQTPSRRLHATP